MAQTTVWILLIVLIPCVASGEIQKRHTLTDLVFQLVGKLKVTENKVEALTQQMTATNSKVESLSAGLRKNLIGFHVVLTKNHNAVGIIPFDKVIYNYGGAWNPLTHTFVAPRKGMYLFILTLMNYPNASYFHAAIRRESTIIQKVHGYTNYEVGTGSTVVILNKGEHIQGRLLRGKLFGNENQWGHFVGVFLHSV